jgi:predicted transcriptional regulator
MAKKRERLEVIFDILKAIQDSGNIIKPTRLMHSSNLSPQMFDEYLQELLSKGFIKEHTDKGKKTYSLEKKGFLFLEEYKVIVRFIDNFGL